MKEINHEILSILLGTKKVLNNAVFLKSCLHGIKVFSSARGQKEGITKGVTPKSEYEGWVGIFHRAKKIKKQFVQRPWDVTKRRKRLRDGPSCKDKCRRGWEL